MTGEQLIALFKSQRDGAGAMRRVRSPLRSEIGRRATRGRLGLLAVSLLLGVGGKGDLMASERKSAVARVVQLPPNWDSLSRLQKFEFLHRSPELVRGGALPGVEVDCRRHMVKDAANEFYLSFSYPTREAGSYSYNYRQRPFRSGRLESLRPDQYRNQHIFALQGPAIHIGGGKYATIEIEEAELKLLADLFRAHGERCAGRPDEHIQTYVILVRRGV